MQPRFVDVEGIRTRYFEEGQGDPLVLVHGGQYGSYYNAYTWSLNLKGLSQRFHVFALDRLGMGFTDNPPEDRKYTMGATIDHVRSFLSTLGLDNVNLVGHSRGAFITARLAMDDPSFVRTLVAVDTNTLAPDDASTPKTFYADLERNAPPVETKGTVQREPRANSFLKDHITEDFVDELYRIALLPKTVQARQKMQTLVTTLFLPDLNAKRQQTIQDLKAGALKTPTLIVWGLNDVSAPLKLGLDLFQIISPWLPQCQFHIFNQAAHYSFREHPTDFNDLVTNFIHLHSK